MLPKSTVVIGALAAFSYATSSTGTSGVLGVEHAPFMATTSESVLEKYAHYCGASYNISYTTDPHDPTWSCANSCTYPDTLGTTMYYRWDDDSHANTGYIAYNNNTEEILLVFRGSRSLHDWIADFEWKHSQWPAKIQNSEVHTGFINAYEADSKMVHGKLAQLATRFPDYAINIIGHSLGAALASIAAATLSIQSPKWIPRMTLYTYGQPRNGNKVFSTWMQSRGFPIFRVVYKGDLVPQLPPMILGYYHHGQELWYNTASGSLVYCGEDGESSSCQNSLEESQLAISDHTLYPGLDDLNHM